MIWVFEMAMITLSKFLDKVYLMAEGGSRYCSKKSDDICGDVCDQVKFGFVNSLDLLISV